jgi:biopolymer transport protein ExbD
MSANLGSNSGQEVELNITPIIDCFTVLITFLLASASFLSIGFFEVYTPGTTASAETMEPDVEIVLKVSANQSVEMKLKGKRNGVTHYLVNDPAALEKLEKEIENLKIEKLTLNQILITAENDVPYQNMAKVMDALQKSAIPVVMGDF